MSGLNFTIENSTSGEIHFFNVLVKQEESSSNTDVYVKTTNSGHCLNEKSGCPKRYMNSTIAAYIRRAITHYSTWKQVHKEIQRSTQVLLNDGFDSNDINTQTKRILDKWYHQE